MKRLSLHNTDLVEASTEQLTYKQVLKARCGRRLTPHLQKKILNALQAAQSGEAFTLKDLFNY